MNTAHLPTNADASENGRNEPTYAAPRSRVEEPEMIVNVWWHNGLVLSYRAKESAARRFALAFNATHPSDSVSLCSEKSHGPHARMPCERNWIGP